MFTLNGRWVKDIRIKQLRKRDPKPVGKLLHVDEGHVPATCFDRGVIRPVHSDCVRKALLTDPKTSPELFATRAE